MQCYIRFNNALPQLDVVLAAPAAATRMPQTHHLCAFRQYHPGRVIVMYVLRDGTAVLYILRDGMASLVHSAGRSGFVFCTVHRMVRRLLCQNQVRSAGQSGTDRL